jgi:hypothetical protein
MALCLKSDIAMPQFTMSILIECVPAVIYCQCQVTVCSALPVSVQNRQPMPSVVSVVFKC